MSSAPSRPSADPASNSILGYGVFTFNDVPKAHAELMTEIDLARADLRTKGVDVD
jgi:hypothetical protein